MDDQPDQIGPREESGEQAQAQGQAREQTEQPEQPEHRVVRGGDGRLRRVRVRSIEIGARKRRLFLDHLAATSNAVASARVAGANIRSFYRLRERDPDFAADWDAALDHAEPRLDGKLIVYAETRGKTQARAGVDEGEGDDLEGFDPELALQILSLHRQRRADRTGRRRGPKPRVATREEVEAAVLKVLDKLEKRLAREGR